MKITTKGCYGLRAMLELAAHGAEHPMSIDHIAKTRGVSRKYLHALLTSLRSAGLVRSVRGPGGGYVLTRGPAAINVQEILLALEGPLAPSNCTGAEPAACVHASTCPAHVLWQHIHEVTTRVLECVTLEQLASHEGPAAGRWQLPG